MQKLTGIMAASWGVNDEEFMAMGSHVEIVGGQATVVVNGTYQLKAHYPTQEERNVPVEVRLCRGGISSSRHRSSRPPLLMPKKLTPLASMRIST